MISNSCAPPATTIRTTAGEHWQHRLREFVRHHLEDPDLSASMIAHHVGVTPRYVQMVFAGMATTGSAYILGERLERAAQLLAERSTSVTDVAFQVGFSDLSYFYRCFRKRFGVSPGRFAAGVRPGRHSSVKR